MQKQPSEPIAIAESMVKEIRLIIINLFYFIHITGHSPIVTTEMKKSGVIHAAQPFIRATSFIHTKAYSMKFKLYPTSRIPAAYRNCIPSI